MQVIFDEDGIVTQKRTGQSTSGPLVRVLMKFSGGRIASEAAAARWLFVIAILAFIASVFIIRSLVIPPPAEPIMPQYADQII